MRGIDPEKLYIVTESSVYIQGNIHENPEMYI